MIRIGGYFKNKLDVLKATFGEEIYVEEKSGLSDGDAYLELSIDCSPCEARKDLKEFCAIIDALELV